MWTQVGAKLSSSNTSRQQSFNESNQTSYDRTADWCADDMAASGNFTTLKDGHLTVSVGGINWSHSSRKRAASRYR
jgi:hypothetical protein